MKLNKRILAMGAVLLSMFVVTSCASDPAAMTAPAIDKLENLIVGSAKDEAPDEKDPDDDEEEATDPVDGFVIPTSAHVVFSFASAAEGGGPAGFTLSGDFDSSEKSPMSSLVMMGSDGARSISTILVDGILYSDEGDSWVECGTSDFLGDADSSDNCLKTYQEMISLALLLGYDTIVSDMVDANEIGIESIDGVKTRKHEYKSSTSMYTFWTDSKGRYVRFMVETEPEGGTATSTWDFTNIDEPVSVKAPI